MSIAESIAHPSATDSVPRTFQQVSAESTIHVRGVSWPAYCEMRDSQFNNHLRMTYDNGALEIMSPSGKHAKVTHIIGFMIDEWSMLHEIDADFGGDMTFRRQEVSRGLEADLCYWIANSAQVRGKDEIDLSIDPPPDLALEVEFSNPVIPKLPIYQALGVPEVWHWRNGTLTILVLDKNRNYVTAQDSPGLPGFPFRLAEEFIRQRQTESGSALLRRLRRELAKLKPKTI